jgi:hypothetical protein
MTRAVFESVDEFKKWVTDNVNPEKYKAFFTSYNEIILVPRKSTKPIEYGYIQISDAEIMKKTREWLVNNYIKFYYDVKAYEWMDEKPPLVEKKLFELLEKGEVPE